MLSLYTNRSAFSYSANGICQRIFIIPLRDSKLFQYCIYDYFTVIYDYFLALREQVGEALTL